MPLLTIQGFNWGGKYHLKKQGEERPVCGLNHFGLIDTGDLPTQDWIEENADCICKRCYEICEETIFQPTE